MTDDQQYVVALATLVVPTIASVMALLQSRSTHSAVNGLNAKNMRRARAAGRASERSVRRAAPQRSVSGDGPSEVDGGNTAA